MSEKCPCGSGDEYRLCCEPRLNGTAPAPDAEALMRSRYTAYVRHNAQYLVSTWHPERRTAMMTVQLEKNFSDTVWQGLTINAVRNGDNHNEAFVTFFARYLSHQRKHAICECSRFLRENQRWYYVDGTWSEPGRNDHCPCGSGKKYKKCCGP